MEERQDVKLVRIEFKCPECETGYLEPTGQVFTTNPPMFPHKCNVCEYGQTFNENYPRLVHEPLDKEEVSPILTEDQILQRLADLMNYNNICARATLYPGLEINEIPQITIEDLKYTGDFITRYETMSKAQARMTGEAYDEAENWLVKNQEKYLKLINK